MANETYDSSKGYIVLPVLHPSSGLHNISVAEDIPDRGSTLRAASEYSHPAIEVHEKQCTADDALENSDSFRKTAASLWMAARAGEGHGEPSIDAQGNPGRVGWNPAGDDTHGSAHVVTPVNAPFAVHAHPNSPDPKVSQPSPGSPFERARDPSDPPRSHDL